MNRKDERKKLAKLFEEEMLGSKFKYFFLFLNVILIIIPTLVFSYIIIFNSFHISFNEFEELLSILMEFWPYFAVFYLGVLISVILIKISFIQRYLLPKNMKFYSSGLTTETNYEIVDSKEESNHG